MRSEGAPLFAGFDTRRSLFGSMHIKMRDTVLDRLLVHPEVSSLELRQVAMAAGATAPVALGEPEQVSLVRSEEKGRTEVTLSCVVPFTGNHQLFGYSVPLWPPPRTVRGLVGEDRLTLTVAGWTGDEAWLPAVLGSELDEIRRILASQAIEVRNYQSIYPKRVRETIRRVLPNIDHYDLRAAHAALPFARNAKLKRMVDQVVTRDRNRLWRAWDE